MHFARIAKLAFVAGAAIAAHPINAAPTIYGTYYDETVGASCGSALYCQAGFAQLPSNKLLKVRKVNCRFLADKAVTAASLYVATDSNCTNILAHNLQLPLPIATSTSQSGQGFLTIESDTQWLIGQGRYPFIGANTIASGQIGLSCTLIGELIDPIQ